MAREQFTQTGEQARQNLKMLRGLFVLVTIGCVVAITSELSKQEHYNDLIRDYIGGPDLGWVFLLSVIGVCAVAMVVWCNRKLRLPDSELVPGREEDPASPK